MKEQDELECGIGKDPIIKGIEDYDQIESAIYDDVYRLVMS